MTSEEEDEDEVRLEALSELLVMLGVEIAGEDPGLPLIDETAPKELLDVPYTGGCADVVYAVTEGRGAV